MSNFVTTGPDGKATVDRTGLVDKIVGDVKPLYTSRSLSQQSRDAFDDATARIREHVAATEQEAADMAELHAKRDLIPGPGLNRLQSEAKERARVAKLSAGLSFDQSFEALEAALLDDALPTFDRSREGLARQELALAIGEASGAALRGRVNTIVRRGSREAVALLLRDEFGRTLLESRGLNGRDLDQTMRDSRKLAAALAAERGATERERAAAAALQKLGTVGALRGAAGR